MKGFYVLSTIPEAILQIPSKKEQQEAAWAVLVYGATGEFPNGIGPIARAILTVVAPNIEAGQKRAEASRANGKLGGRPKKAENLDEAEEEPSNNLDKNPADNLGKNLEKPSNNLDSAYRFNLGLPLPPTPPIPTRDKRLGIYTPLPPKTQVEPTLDDVISIAEEQGISRDEAERFYNYYNSQGWQFGNGRHVSDLSSALKRWVQTELKGMQKTFAGERRYTKEQLNAMVGNLDDFDDF